MLKKIPDTFIIIFTLIIISAVLTWFVQGGEYVNKDEASALVNWVEVSELDGKPDSTILIGQKDTGDLLSFSENEAGNHVPFGRYIESADSIKKFKWEAYINSDTPETKSQNLLTIGGEILQNGKTTPEFIEVDNTPQSFQVFTAFQKGFADQAEIIIFVLIVGGVFWIVNYSRAIDAGVYSLLRRLNNLEKHAHISPKLVNNIILIIIMVIFSAFGAIFGMSEETIAFVAILIPLTISMGYDSITGVSVVFVAAGLGFAGAILNPFTIGIAQKIAGIKMFTGIEYRMVCWIVLNIIGFSYILWYANRVHKNPKSSTVYKIDSYWRNRAEEQKTITYYTTNMAWIVYGILQIITIVYAVLYPKSNIQLGNSEINIIVLPVFALFFGLFSIITLRKSVHFFVLNLLLFTILYLLIGVMGYDWYINEISALFLLLGISSGIAMKVGGNKIVKLFMEGAKDILSAALIIGLAGGIIIILKEGQIIDTILYKAASTMQGLGKSATIGIMYLIQTFLNIIIPSGSAKAAITMPIMAPFSDLVNLSRQSTVVAFQFGDGFTNMITPTSGVLMAVLGVSKIPWTIWVKWVFPLIIILVIVGYLLLLPTVYLDLNGF